ncbi:hypothetical protein F443_22397 [Phytophthora nicotianae P1569]|uniref:Uncharacterized protein n=1 Tax=Phytophthora nicotianae P1569 TaxID=1317065 RepID=V9DUE7_PHYNI|nr:hypothetical protein F443_22397 [Phytophthora nicotianae P1569]
MSSRSSSPSSPLRGSSACPPHRDASEPAHARSPSPGLDVPAPLDLLALVATATSHPDDTGQPEEAPITCPECAQILAGSTARVDRPQVDLAAVRRSLTGILTSLRVLQASVDRESVVEELQEEHHDLQRVHATAIRHTRDLHTRLSQAGSAAQPFIQFCQERYDAVVRELGVTSALLTDERVSVHRLEAELASVASIREEHRRLQVSSAVAARRSQRQIEILERPVVDLRSQLTALTRHPDLGSAPPPALARRLQAQDREMRSSRDRIATLERSEKA